MRRKNLFVIFVVVAMLIVTMSAAVLPGAAQGEVASATFYVYVSRVSGATVNVHQVTSPWSEGEVTWNLRPTYIGTPLVGSFVADGLGWRSVDMTELVQAWVDNPGSNYGLLLEQGATDYTHYPSSEFLTYPDRRPKLSICYVDGTCVTLQRGLEESIVADAYILENYPNLNRGAEIALYTGLVDGYEKRSLIRFVIPPPPPPPGEGCTPGYWRQEHHYDSWVPTGYSPDDDFDTTFGVDLFSPDITLGQAAWANGGGVNKLARHGTAALLSAAHPDVNYPFTVAEVLAYVQAGDADTLAAANELGCPLD